MIQMFAGGYKNLKLKLLSEDLIMTNFFVS